MPLPWQRRPRRYARIITRRSAYTERFLSLTFLSNVVAYACRHSRAEDRQMATPGQQRSTSGSFASSPITIGPTSWVRLKNDGRKGRKGRKALAPIRRVEFVNDFNHRDGPVSAARRGRKVAESAGKSLQEPLREKLSAVFLSHFGGALHSCVLKSAASKMKYRAFQRCYRSRSQQPVNRRRKSECSSHAARQRLPCLGRWR
jgi:hypothetical protein